MSLKDDIVEKFEQSVQKQNPWMPYRGEAGGQGWQNMITGEVRYQDARPAPGEGMPEDYEGDVPSPAEEPPDELEPPSEEELLAEHIEEGDEVTFEDLDTGDTVEAEIVGNTDSETGPLIQTEEGEQFQAMWGELDTSPYELEPETGWGDRWMESPDHFTDLETDQTVEVYDLETNQYLEGEVQMIEEDDPGFEGDYISIVTEEKGTIEIVPGVDVGEEYLITAQEDLDYVPGVPDDLEGVNPHDLGEEVEEGDTVALDIQEDISWVPEEDEALVGEVDEDGNIRLGEYDGSERMIDPSNNGHLTSLDQAWVEPMEFLDPLEVPGFEENPDLVEGEVLQMDHPAFGEIEDEVQVSQDPQGHTWVSTQMPDVEEGDWTEFLHPTYENEVEGEVVQVGESKVVMDTDPSDPSVDYLEVPFENLDETKDVSLTTNPEHPLYVGDHAQGVTNPWEETESASDFSKVMPGDKVLVDGETLDVAERTVEGLELADGTFLEPHELDQIEAKFEQEKPDPPMGYDTWKDQPDTLNPEDTVMFYDEEADEMVGGEVYTQAQEDADEVEVETEDGEVHVVDRNDIEGYIDTGEAQLPEGDTLDWADTGDYVQVQYKEGYDDDIVQAEGFVMGEDHYNGVTLWDPHAETSVNVGDSQDAVIIDEPDPPEDYGGTSGEPPEQVAEEMEESLNLGAHSLQGEVRGQLMKHHSPEAVSELMQSLVDSGPGGVHAKPWKRNSNNELANRWEEALAEAAGINAPVLGGMKPSKEAIEAAATINEISQRRWEANTPDRVYRGLGDAGGAGLMANFLLDPFESEEYDVPTRAVANWTEQQHTAEGLGTSPIVVHRSGDEIPSDWVAAYHDDFFQHSNDGEAEISMQGDKTTVSRENIYVDKNESHNFGEKPHNWGEEEASAFKNKVDRYGTQILDQYNTADSPKLRRQQLENAVRLEMVLNENGEHTETNHFFTEVRDRLRDNHDVDPDSIAYPELESGGGDGDLPVEEIQSADGFVEGMEVEAIQGNEKFPGEVMGVNEDGTVEVANVDTGMTHDMNPGEITDVVYSPDPYGAPAQADTSNWDTSDLEPLDDLKVWRGGEWEDASVLEVQPDGTVEVSMDSTGMNDYYDDFDLQEGRIVPEGAIGEEAEGPDDSGFQPVDSMDDIEPGDTVEIEGWDEPHEITDYYPPGPNEDEPSAVWVGTEENPEVDMVTTDQIEGVVEDTGPDLEPGTVIDHPEFTSEVTVSEITDDGDVIVEDSSGFDYNLGLETSPTDDIDSDWIVDESDVDIDDVAVGDKVTLSTDEEVYVTQEEFDGDGFYVATEPDADTDDQFYVEPDDIHGHEPEGSDGGTPSAGDELNIDDVPDLNEGDQVVVEWPEIDEQEVATVDDVTTTVGGDPSAYLDYGEGTTSFSPATAEDYNFYTYDDSSEGSDEESDLGLGDFGLVENESVTFDTGNGIEGGFAEYVDSDTGEVVVQQDGKTVQVNPEDIEEADVSDDQSILGDIEDDFATLGDDDQEWEPVDGPEDVSPGDSVRVQTSTMDEPEVKEVVDVKESGTVEFDDGQHVISSAVSDYVEVESEGSGGSELPDMADTDIVNGSPNYDDIEEGDLVEVDGAIYEVDAPPDSPSAHMRVDTGDNEMFIPQTDANAIVEPSDGSDDSVSDWEAGEEVTLDNDLDPSHPDSINSEFGEVTESFEMAGETFYAVDTPDGERIGEFTADELANLSEGSDESEGGDDDSPTSPESVDWDAVEWEDASALDLQGGVDPGTPVQWVSPIHGEQVGTFEGIDDQGVQVVPSEDSEEETGVSGTATIPTGEVSAIGEESEGSDDSGGDVAAPTDVHEMSPGMAEEFSLEFPGGPVDVIVMDVPEDPAGPYTVNDENNNDWLVWPGGDVEPV